MKRYLVSMMLLACAACATKGDVRRIETRLGDLTLQSAEGDSAGAALLSQLIREMRLTQRQSRSYLDSLRAELVGIRSTSAELRGTVRSMQSQLATIEELTGQTQARLGQLETQLRDRDRGGYEPGVAAAEPGSEVAELLEAGRDLAASDSPATARIAFHRVLTEYPDDPGVPEALYYLGDSFLSTGMPDSARVYFTELATNHSGSARMPEALYRLALLADQEGDSKTARMLFLRVLDLFPESEAAGLAERRLRDR